MMRARHRIPASIPSLHASLCMSLCVSFCASLCVMASAARTHQQPSQQARQQPPRFRTGAEGVGIDVLVTNGERPVPGLTTADFELTDRGVGQQIDVTSLNDRPIDVIVVLDVSISLGETGLRHLIGAMEMLLGNLRKEDRAALVTFSEAVVIRAGLTSEHARIRDMARGLTLRDKTSIIDAVYAATTLRDATDRASLLLVFSDGVDNSSWLPRDTVLDIVLRSPVVPYAVAVMPRTNTGAPVRNAAITAAQVFLEDLVTTGGGLLIHADDTRQIGERFAAAIDSFRQRYLLTYTPRGVEAAGWHPVTIKVKGRGYRIRARSGYAMP